MRAPALWTERLWTLPSSAVLALLTAVSTAATAQQQSLTPAAQAAIARVEAQLTQDVQTDSIGSITAGVALGERVVWAKGFGWADSDRKIPAGPETIYRTGSISKSFTAVALVQLVERGILELDDRVERYFPEITGLADPPEGAEPITFRQLASHTAGLIREPRLEGAASGPIEGWEDKILASIPTTSFKSRPGTEYSYSNIGFGILGLAISRAADKPFMDLIEELLFDPLGMTSSTFIICPDLEPHLAVGYVNRRDGTIDKDFPAREHAGRGYKVPNGGIYSTVGDLAQFAAALSGAHEPPVLTEESRREILRIQTPESDTLGYGLGFSVRVNDDGSRHASHGGSVAGYNAYLAFDPDAQISVVLLRNYNRGSTSLGRTARGLLRELVAAQAAR